MSDVESLIDALNTGEQSVANKAFDGVMQDKLNMALDAKKIELANDVYSGITDAELQNTETETD
jgi:hypothetical protein